MLQEQWENTQKSSQKSVHTHFDFEHTCNACSIWQISSNRLKSRSSLRTALPVAVIGKQMSTPLSCFEIGNRRFCSSPWKLHSNYAFLCFLCNRFCTLSKHILSCFPISFGIWHYNTIILCCQWFCITFLEFLLTNTSLYGKIDA